MVAPHAESILGEYLRRLDRELADLPRGRRAEIVADIEEHIAAARAQVEGETDADVRSILDRIGDPAVIGAEARERFDVTVAVPEPGGLELLAMLLVGAGTLVFAFLPWAAGAALVWYSPCWRRRDKRVGVWLPLAGWVAMLLGAPRLDSARGVVATLAAVGLPLAGSAWLASHLPRRRAVGARAATALVSTLVAVPVLASVIPVARYGFVALGRAQQATPAAAAAPGAVHCGGFYGTTEVAASAGGARVPINAGICWNGHAVWKVWGPNCGGSSGPLLLGDSQTCTVRAAADGSLIVSSEVHLRASTSAVFSSSSTMAWRIKPDGNLVQLAP